VVAAGLAVAVTATPAAAYPYADVSLTGHGWGPGTGMGQWGALGEALGGSTDTQILSSYYGTLANGSPTTIDTLPNGWTDAATPVTVAITANAGDSVIVTSAAPFTVSSDPSATFGPGGTYEAAMFQISTDPMTLGTWNVFGDPQGSLNNGCGGPNWTQIETAVAPPVATPVTAAPFPSPSGNNLDSELLQLCMPGGNLYARGSLGGADNSAKQERTVNVLPLGQYVSDVTPSESPTSWGALGGTGPQGEPWGFQELEAQAVAARSYVMSTYGSLQGYFGYADICDSTCQDYPGVANENTLTDAAVTDTADTVVRMPDGAVAQTQYSSSTGGWTAPGNFAAVPDPGDAVCVPGACNQHHIWQAQVPVAAVESAYPEIGTLVSVGVSQRNGLGDLGGRAVQMTLQGTAGSATVGGSAFASQFAQYGVQSDWFAVTSQPSGGVGGYWLSAADGGVFSFGNAAFEGSMGATHLNAPVVGMAGTPDGGGYWLVAADGGVFSFGDAGFHGSMGAVRLNSPVVGIAPTAGAGYWMVAGDGGIFAFGDAGFHGSMGATHLNAPVVGMAPTPDGGGYWLVAADGGVFSFGDAGFEGSLPGVGVHATATGILPTHTGSGYLILTTAGEAVDFGDAPQFGDVSTSVTGWSGHLVGGATAPG